VRLVLFPEDLRLRRVYERAARIRAEADAPLGTQRGEVLPRAHPDRLALPLSHGTDHVRDEAPSGMRCIDARSIAMRLASRSVNDGSSSEGVGPEKITYVADR
jgi:hypothetical protein